MLNDQMNSTERCAKNKRVLYKMKKMKKMKTKNDSRIEKDNSYCKSSLGGNESNKRYRAMRSMRSMKSRHNSLTESMIKKEMEDPNNEYLKDQFDHVISLRHRINILSADYDALKITKKKDEAEINKQERLIDKSVDVNYQYKPYLKGVKESIDDFLLKNQDDYALRENIEGNAFRKTHNALKSKDTNYFSTDQSSIIFINTMPSPNNNTETFSVTNANAYIGQTATKKNEHLESLYNSLGHESYIQLLRVFERYCHYGKTFTNFAMDYSQFCSMFKENNLYEKVALTKGDLEVVYNKIKKTNGINKTVSFEEFILILDEIAKNHYSWEQTMNNRVKYFFNQFIVGIPCLKKTIEDKHIERWYYFLETDDFKVVIKKHMRKLYELYKEYKGMSNDLIDMNSFIKLCKDKRVIPVFLTSKEIISVVSFVKYQKKQYLPTNSFDFSSFVEIICTLAIQAYDKYLTAEQGNNQKKRKYIEHTERMNMFLAFLMNTHSIEI